MIASKCLKEDFRIRSHEVIILFSRRQKVEFCMNQYTIHSQTLATDDLQK